MRVPHYVLNAVAFLGWRDEPTVDNPDPQEQYAGTGFVIVWEQGGIAFSYLATADHVARALETVYEPFAKLNDTQGRGYHYSLNKPASYIHNGKTYRIPAWYRHPADASADVAITNFLPSWATGRRPDASLPYVPTYLFVEDKDLHPVRGHIGIGDEVFIAGLFTHVAGQDSNSPILRIGNLAMLPKERIYVGGPYGYMEAFLIETRSIGGISGSPIFVRGTHKLSNAGALMTTPTGWGVSAGPETVASSAEYSLLGVAHGHWNIRPDDLNAPNPLFVRSGLNVGIGIVTPAKKILETLHHPALAAEREDFIKAVEKKKGSAVQDSLRGDSEFTRADFLADLKKVVAKRQDAEPLQRHGPPSSEKLET